MEYQKIANSLDNASNEPSKLVLVMILNLNYNVKI